MATESIQDIKRRIGSVSSTERITNSMKLVSAGKLRKVKALFETINVNSHYVTDTIASVFGSGDQIPEKYILGNAKDKRTAYIVIASSRGLCGGYNSNVMKMAQSLIDQDKEKDPIILAIGSRTRDYFEKRGYEIADSYLGAVEEMNILQVRAMIAPIIHMFVEEEIEKVVVVHTKFVNSMDQSVTSSTLLPVSIDEEDIKEQEGGYIREVEYKPSVAAVIDYLVPKYVETKLFMAVIESATCEHAARRLAMENATDNAREMLDTLNLNYNRARQAAITDEIIEIVAGSEAQN